MLSAYKTRSDFDKGRRYIEDVLPYSGSSQETWAEYFREEVEALIAEKTIRYAGDNSRYVDVVGDVINLAPVRWISEKIVSISNFRSADLICLDSLDFR
jgi:linoleate 10R-lipoxygenase